MARVYKRDNRGRFASAGGNSGGRPAAKRVQRGTNRLTRDNAGRIQGVGGSGATARGGRLRTASGNQRATQLDRLKGRISGTVSRGGKVKTRPVGWAQSPAARADRVSGAKDRSHEARLLKSLPKETRRAIRLARKTSANPLGARYRNSINEGATTLRSNFGKRKGLTPGAAESISKAMQHSARKLRAAVAEPRPGQRLRSGGPGRRVLSGDRIKAAGRLGGTVAKPKGGAKARPVPARLAGRSAADQASRDAWAQRYKRLPKEIRRAIGTAKYGRKGPNEHLPFGRTASARKIKSTTRAIRSDVIDAGFYLASNRSPFGRKALSKAERAGMVASVLQGARSLRARSAVRRYGRRMGGGGTAKAAGARPGGTVAKPKGLKPEPARRLRTAVAISRMRAVNQRMAGRADQAVVNIGMRGSRGKALERSIDRAVAQVRSAQRLPVRSPKASTTAPKPKRTRTPQSKRLSRAKQVEKRRSISMNPAGWRDSAAARMAANASRTQARALAFYGRR